MSPTRPLILMSNDDGVTAAGLRFLIETLRPVADLLVVAPDGARSGFSTSITSAHPIVSRRVSAEDGLTVYACSGTPVDCTKLGLNRYAARRPDLVVSGVNHGDNSSVNAHYSGTVGVVAEAAMQGIPAVAFSSCNESAQADLSPLAPYVTRVVEHVLREGLPPFTCLNVNFPAATPFGGMRVCRMARTRWVKEMLDCTSGGRSGDWFWLGGHRETLEPDATDTDDWALSHGFVAVTPVTLDNTDYSLLARLGSVLTDIQ